MISKVTANVENRYNCQKPNSQSFAGHGEKTNLSRKQKAVILASSAAGMIPVMAVLAHRKGFSLNPSKIAKTPVKDWAIFKYAPVKESVEFEAPQVFAVASGSVAGGFIGGALVDDKSNLKAKKREALTQLLGNVLVPVLCVAGGSAIFSKYSARLQNVMPQINKNSKTIQFINKCLRNIPQAIATVTFLGLGIYAGNRVSNLINEKLYHKRVERNIKPTDFAPHFDDLCIATSMMDKESTFGSKLGRVIPIALLVPGYQTGIAQKHPH